MNDELQSALARLAAINPYRTSDLDAARAQIGTLFVPHTLEVVGRNQVLDVCIARARLENVSFVYHRHGAGVHVRPQLLRDFFLLQIPVRGWAYVTVDQQGILCSPKQAVMISPTLGADMSFGAGCEQLIVRVERADLERHLEQQLGRPLSSPLEFVPGVPLGTQGAEQIVALLRFMLSLTDGEGIGGSAFARRHMALLLFSSLLICLDHNYRDELASGGSRPRPIYIANAQAFIERNLGQAIGPGDIAAAVHVSARALFAGFRAYLNTTPMRYLKVRRLHRVQAALAKLEPNQTSMTTIAMEYGFHHVGHFCAAYREQFGKLPRETLYKVARFSSFGDIASKRGRRAGRRYKQLS